MFQEIVEMQHSIITVTLSTNTSQLRAKTARRRLATHRRLKEETKQQTKILIKQTTEGIAQKDITHLKGIEKMKKFKF